MVRVDESAPGGLAQDIRVGARHLLRADEPADAGGADLGPSPYQFLAAGLGACTSMTIRMYARRKDWPLEHVSVDVIHDRRHADDCADCPDKAAKIDVFHREIRLTGPLDTEQRARLMEIADRCPVHRTLTGTIRIETEQAGA